VVKKNQKIIFGEHGLHPSKQKYFLGSWRVVGFALRTASKRETIWSVAIEELNATSIV